MNNDNYCVVMDSLQQQINKLIRISSMSGNNIMDQIRWQQIHELECAMECWQKYKHEWIDSE